MVHESRCRRGENRKKIDINACLWEAEDEWAGWWSWGDTQKKAPGTAAGYLTQLSLPPQPHAFCIGNFPFPTWGPTKGLIALFKNKQSVISMIHSTKLHHLELWMCVCFKFKSNAFTLELLLYKSYAVYFQVLHVILLKLKEELIEAPNVSSFFFFNSCTIFSRAHLEDGMCSEQYITCTSLYYTCRRRQCMFNACAVLHPTLVPEYGHRRSPWQNEEIITGRQLQKVHYWFISSAFQVPNNVKVTSSILSDALKNIVFPPNQSWM